MPLRLADLPAGDGPITVVHLHRVDQRDVLSNDTTIADGERLRRQVEPYRRHLDLIAANPGVRAPDLAARIDLDTATFKAAGPPAQGARADAQPPRGLPPVAPG